MRHLIVSREYPPSNYSQGGIGVYVAHIGQALADRGEIVHIIAERWAGAPQHREVFCDGRLIVHRISPNDVDLYPSQATNPRTAHDEMVGMRISSFPAQWFSWVAAGLAERLVEQEQIDVIEGQEWEAPLYYFLLRRSLGLGPARRPPCITHLHSPTEFIFRHNDWSPARPEYLPMKRFEDHVIKAADALLCPSRYLAEQSEAHYGLRTGSITVIPLPMGDTGRLNRTEETWENGSICYFGRLEPRKGIIEFVDAAVRIAQERDVLFEFIGSDLPYSEAASVGSLVRERIPGKLHKHFVFYQPQSRPRALAMLAKARMVVVPSRWENFPNTCVEALASGVPVLATRNGGMAEMIEHERTGWLVDEGPALLADRIAATLHTAVDTPSDRLRQMGADAADGIRRFCDNTAIASRHSAFRSHVNKAGITQSNRIPIGLPWPERAARPRARKVARSNVRSVGVAVIARHGQNPEQALASLANQTRLPDKISLVSPQSAIVPSSIAAKLSFFPHIGVSSASARQLALSALASTEALLFLEAGDVLEPNALELMMNALNHCPEVGLVSAWHRDGMMGPVNLSGGACPAFPYQWFEDERLGRPLFRGEALLEATTALMEDEGAVDDWSLATAILANGWASVRLPTITCNRASRNHDDNTSRRRGRRILSALHYDLVHSDAGAILYFAGEQRPTFSSAQGFRYGRRFWGRVLRAIRRPRRTARRIARELSAWLRSDRLLVRRSR